MMTTKMVWLEDPNNVAELIEKGVAFDSEILAHMAEHSEFAAAKFISGVKQIREIARAIQQASSQVGDADMQRFAAEIKVRAERQIGKMLQSATASDCQSCN